MLCILTTSRRKIKNFNQQTLNREIVKATAKKMLVKTMTNQN